MPKRFFASIKKEELGRHPFRIIVPLVILLFLSAGSLYYWKSNSVSLTYDGRTRRIFTSARNLKELLDEQHIALGPSDFTTPSLDTPIGHNTAAKITRVSVEQMIQISTGTPKIIWQNRTRENLRRVLVQRGYTVIVRDKVQITKHDGIEISRAILSESKKRQPFFTLTLFNNLGQPALTYDLLKCKKLIMRATGYYVGEKTVPSDVTFQGHKLQRGLVAVDPTVIPLKSRLYVSGYGYAYADDTGSKIKGLRIDLAVSGKREEQRFNRHDVPVYILDQTKRW